MSHSCTSQPHSLTIALIRSSKKIRKLLYRVSTLTLIQKASKDFTQFHLRNRLIKSRNLHAQSSKRTVLSTSTLFYHQSQAQINLSSQRGTITLFPSFLSFLSRKTQRISAKLHLLGVKIRLELKQMVLKIPLFSKQHLGIGPRMCNASGATCSPQARSTS